MNICTIVLARGGSIGVPKKNIIDFCGKPLIAWTIEHCMQGGAEPIYVSSDSDEILEVGLRYGALPIERPLAIAGNYASSESGWLHALNVIEDKSGSVDWVLAPQVTSPLRTADDLRKGIDTARTGNYDSLFSCSVVWDFSFGSSNPKDLKV